MLVMFCLYGIGLFIATIVVTIEEIVSGRTSSAIVSISLFIVMAILGIIVTYFGLPSRNALSILMGNGFITGFYIMVNSFTAFTEGDEIGWSNGIIGTIAVVAIVVSLIGEIHSGLSVKSSVDSINSEVAKSTEAPTFKKGETPVAISPKTILNKVRKSISDVPRNYYYQIDSNLQAQYYKGKPVYIIPIEYQGFFASRKANYIPGYFMIDATSVDSSPKFIAKRMNYSNSSYFGNDVSRVIYRHYPEWLVADDSEPQLEIDDNGTPYWVETVYKPEAFSHRVDYSKLRVVTVNATTGDTNIYRLNKTPKFVDEGITSDVAVEMNEIYGKYQNGFWNAHFGKTNLKEPTNNGPDDGVTSVFNKNGTISYFVDFTTSSSSADSAVGYSMINAKTGKFTYYKTSGIMDSNGATKNADQNYRAQKWNAKMPVLYNVDGHPTWVMSILDSTGSMRGYYYLDASDQSVYGTGANAELAVDSYRQALIDGGGSVGNSSITKVSKVSGIVDRMLVVSNSNKVLFSLKDSDIIYTINTDDYPKAQLLSVGDSVEFSATVVDGSSVGNISSFTNNTFK